MTPDVLIPRPETELLVEAALELLRGAERPVIVDVGTGSGCIALSLAAERQDAELHATDVSAAALAVARDNARRLGLEGRVAFHHGDLLEPVAAVLARPRRSRGQQPAVRRPGRARLARSGGPRPRAGPGPLPARRRPHRLQAAGAGRGGGPQARRARSCSRSRPRWSEPCPACSQPPRSRGSRSRPDLAARPRAVIGRQPLRPRSRVE